MGMYTGMRFKGIIKSEFRAQFECAALRGEWENLTDETLKNFGSVSRSSLIPCGALAYMPDSWEVDYIDENGQRKPMFESDIGKPEEEIHFWEGVASDGFERQYNSETGYWAFQCSLKNYGDTIEKFLAMVPYFIQEIIYCETLYEECDEPTIHTLSSINHTLENNCKIYS